MSYIIRIEEVKDVKRMISGAWVKIADNGPNNYGYAPDREEIKKEERAIYIQEVETLDLKAVINAVNTQTNQSK